MREISLLRFPPEVEFRLQRVERTFAELRDIQARIGARWKALEAEGVDITSTGLRDDLNVVEVGVANFDGGVANELEDEFGPGVLIRAEHQAVADACKNVHDCRPIKGGLEIRSQWNNGECTSGFVVKRLSTGTMYLLTAGHCIAVNGGYDKKWEHNHPDAASNAFGWSRYETWVNGGSSYADVGLTTISADEVPTLKNQIYVGGGVTNNIVDFDYWPSQLVGEVALMFGQTGGDYGGTITRRMVQNESEVPGVGSMTVTETMQVSFNPDGGDSGGPVFYLHPNGGSSRIALGTHVHSDAGTSSATGDGWYSPVDRGYADMIQTHGGSWEYAICETASC